MYGDDGNDVFDASDGTQFVDYIWGGTGTADDITDRDPAQDIFSECEIY